MQLVISEFSIISAAVVVCEMASAMELTVDNIPFVLVTIRLSDLYHLVIASCCDALCLGLN